MKIAIVTATFPARSETFVTQIADSMARQGHCVQVFAEGIGGDISQDEIQACLKHFQIIWTQGPNTNRWQRLKSYIMGVTEINQKWIDRFKSISLLFRLNLPGRLHAGNLLLNLMHKKFDVIHIHNGSLAYPVVLLAESGLVSGKIVVTWHGSDANQLPLKYGGHIYQKLFCRPWIHTVGSTFMFSRLIELGANEKNIRKIPLGIDLDFFKPDTKLRQAQTKFRIVSVGRLSEEKGHIFLLRAVAVLVQKGFDLEVIIIGEGPERIPLEREITQLGGQNYVVLAGAQNSNQIRSEMNRANLFVLSCVRGATNRQGSVESQGVVFAEAQAMGLPVVSSKIGGVPDSVENGVTGILCKPGSVGQLVLAIQKLMTDKLLWQEYSENSRCLAEQKFDKNRMISAFEKVYLE